MRKPSYVIAALILLAGLGWYAYSSRDTAQLPAALLRKPAVAAAPNRNAPPLSLWAWGPSADESDWQRRADEFRIQTGQSVQLTYHASADAYRDAVNKARKNGSLPDVFLVDAREAESFYHAGDLALLDPPRDDAQNWLPAAVAPFQRNGRYIAWPTDFSLLALYYNRTTFDRLGIAYPDIHWNWTILLALSRTLYQAPNKEHAQPVYGIEFPLNFDLWQAMSRQAGHGIYHDAVWELGVQDGALAQSSALEFLRDYFKVYIVAAPPRTAADGEYFRQGAAVLAIAGPELIPQLRGATDFKWGVAPLPRGEERATTLQVEGWAVSAQSHDPFTASQLAAFIARQSRRADWLPAYVGPGAPARSPEQNVFYQAAANAGGPPLLESAPEIEAFVNRELLRWINLKEPSTKDFINLVNNNFHLQPKQ